MRMYGLSIAIPIIKSCLLRRRPPGRAKHCSRRLFSGCNWRVSPGRFGYGRSHSQRQQWLRWASSCFVVRETLRARPGDQGRPPLKAQPIRMGQNRIATVGFTIQLHYAFNSTTVRVCKPSPWGVSHVKFSYNEPGTDGSLAAVLRDCGCLTNFSKDTNLVKFRKSTRQ